MFSCVEARAGIYKCLENGKTVFRDKPCKAGAGKEFSLGATIENTDPTGTLGDISGSWKHENLGATIRDALGILDRKQGLLSLYLVPDRFTAGQVGHFRDTGDDSILKQNPVGKHAGYAAYPFINLKIRFSNQLPRKWKTVEAVEILFYGEKSGEPRVVQLDSRQAQKSIRYVSVFEDVIYGDINLESDGEKDGVTWNISIRAPLYYHQVQ